MVPVEFLSLFSIFINEKETVIDEGVTGEAGHQILAVARTPKGPLEFSIKELKERKHFLLCGNEIWARNP